VITQFWWCSLPISTEIEAEDTDTFLCQRCRQIKNEAVILEMSNKLHEAAVTILTTLKCLAFPKQSNSWLLGLQLRDIYKYLEGNRVYLPWKL